MQRSNWETRGNKCTCFLFLFPWCWNLQSSPQLWLLIYSFQRLKRAYRDGSSGAHPDLSAWTYSPQFTSLSKTNLPAHQERGESLLIKGTNSPLHKSGFSARPPSPPPFSFAHHPFSISIKFSSSPTCSWQPPHCLVCRRLAERGPGWEGKL